MAIQDFLGGGAARLFQEAVLVIDNENDKHRYKKRSEDFSILGSHQLRATVFIRILSWCINSFDTLLLPDRPQ